MIEIDVKPGSKDLENLKKEAYLALLTSGRILTIETTGGSMYPILKSGDVISIKYRPLDSMKVGDIVAYKRAGQVNIVAHRIVKKVRQNGRICLISKGDTFLDLDNDRFLYKEDVLGKVIARNRNGKILRFEGRFIQLVSYIYALALFYQPWILKFLKKIIKIVLIVSKLIKI